jgi:hypothetical protein
MNEWISVNDQHWYEGATQKSSYANITITPPSIELQLILTPKHIPVETLVIKDVPGRKVNILGGHSIGHSKQKGVYVHVSYSERFPR